MKIENIKRTPIGILPRKYYNKYILEDIEMNGGMDISEITRERLMDLHGAILRYTEAKINIPIEWIEEYNMLIELTSK